MSKDISYLLDIAKFCKTIMRLTDNMTKEQFLNDEKTQLAVLYEITVIGEVVKRLTSDFREQHSQIKWRQIHRMGDRLIHDYDEVDLILVWQVIKNNIPKLLVYITRLIPKP